MTKPLPNTVIQRSKRRRPPAVEEELGWFTMEKKVDKVVGDIIYEGSIYLEDQNTYCDIIVVEKPIGRASFDIIITVASLKDSIDLDSREFHLYDPPSVHDPSFFNHKSWRVTNKTERDEPEDEVEINPDCWWGSKTFEEAFKEAFKVVCTRWFFKGR